MSDEKNSCKNCKHSFLSGFSLCLRCRNDESGYSLIQPDDICKVYENEQKRPHPMMFEGKEGKL